MTGTAVFQYLMDLDGNRLENYRITTQHDREGTTQLRGLRLSSKIRHLTLQVCSLGSVVDYSKAGEMSSRVLADLGQSASSFAKLVASSSSACAHSYTGCISIESVLWSNTSLVLDLRADLGRKTLVDCSVLPLLFPSSHLSSSSHHTTMVTLLLKMRQPCDETKQSSEHSGYRSQSESNRSSRFDRSRSTLGSFL